MSLAFGRYSARSGLRARRPTERGSKPGQPCTHGINLGVKKRTSLPLDSFPPSEVCRKFRRKGRYATRQTDTEVKRYGLRWFTSPGPSMSTVVHGRALALQLHCDSWKRVITMSLDEDDDSELWRAHLQV